MGAIRTPHVPLKWFAAATVPILALAGASALNSGVHPSLSRQAVIDAALYGYDHGEFPRVAAKLVHRQDLTGADPQTAGTGDPNQVIWVVAISGNYGIAPSFGCCSVPSDYHGKNTWGVAIIPDAPGRPEVIQFETSYHEDWPPYFNSLPDLAAAGN